MVPTIHPGDMVIVYGGEAQVGDIVVWCTSPLYCVVHRLVDVRDGLIVTKGDANPLPDNPVPVSRLKGRVVAIIPWYVWIPLLLASLLVILAPSLASTLRREDVSPIALAAGIFGFYVAVAAILPFFYTSMSIVMLGYVKPPVLFAAKIGFDAKECAITINYVGKRGLHVLGIDRVTVNGVAVETYVLGNDTLRIYLPSHFLTEFVESSRNPRLRVVVDAVLTRLGHLKGSYSVTVPFVPLKVARSGRGVVIVNPNCYPVHVNVTFLYAYRAGGKWMHASDVVLVDRVFEAKPPVNASLVYVIVSYKAYGNTYTVRLRLS